jgi:bicarbonate transport system ATP-binding protein
MITHDIDEALFLADRVVMMTNGPSAYIGEDLKIPFPRPRNRARIMEDPQYYQLRNFALDFLFRRFAHSEVEEEDTTASNSTINSLWEQAPEINTNTKQELATKSAASATKTFVTSLFNTLKGKTEANMSSDLSSSHSSKASESSPAKTITLGALWLATIIGLTAVSVGSVSNLKKEAAQTEATAVSASPIPISSPSLLPSPVANSASATATSAAPTTVASSPVPANSAPANSAPANSAPANSAPATTPTTNNIVVGITDKNEIEALKQKLYTQMDTTWTTTPTFTEDLVYRIKVNQDGVILEYEATNKPAKDFVQETPLASVQKSASATSETPKKSAEFQLTFSPTNGGVIDVKPWQ